MDSPMIAVAEDGFKCWRRFFDHVCGPCHCMTCGQLVFFGGVGGWGDSLTHMPFLPLGLGEDLGLRRVCFWPEGCTARDFQRQLPSGEH